MCRRNPFTSGTKQRTYNYNCVPRIGSGSIWWRGYASCFWVSFEGIPNSIDIFPIRKTTILVVQASSSKDILFTFSIVVYKKSVEQSFFLSWHDIPWPNSKTFIAENVYLNISIPSLVSCFSKHFAFWSNVWNIRCWSVSSSSQCTCSFQISKHMNDYVTHDTLGYISSAAYKCMASKLTYFSYVALPNVFFGA